MHIHLNNQEKFCFFLIMHHHIQAWKNFFFLRGGKMHLCRPGKLLCARYCGTPNSAYPLKNPPRFPFLGASVAKTGAGLNAIEEPCKVMYLPPNVTCLIRPMDQGIIKKCKKLYKNHILRMLILKEDETNVLQRMKKLNMKDCHSSFVGIYKFHESK